MGRTELVLLSEGDFVARLEVIGWWVERPAEGRLAGS